MPDPDPLPSDFSAEHRFDIEEMAALAVRDQPVRVLDLCCGAGGVGYALNQLPDLRFIGVDIEDHSDTYPGEFIQADVSTLALEDLNLDRPVDLVWASPPCRAYSKLAWIRHDNPKAVYPTFDDLNIRDVATRLGKEFVIENVPTCNELRSPAEINGPALGLDIIFKRHFETSFPLPDHTRPASEDTVRFEDAGNQQLADAKEVPNWGKTPVRAAVPPRYVGYVIAHCPTLQDYSFPDAQDAYAAHRTPQAQSTLTSYHK